MYLSSVIETPCRLRFKRRYTFLLKLRGHRLAWEDTNQQQCKVGYKPGALAVEGSSPSGPINYYMQLFEVSYNMWVAEKEYNTYNTENSPFF
jgi:hypothetical protein